MALGLSKCQLFNKRNLNAPIYVLQCFKPYLFNPLPCFSVNMYMAPNKTG